jgi:pantothenate kinase type III
MSNFNTSIVQAQTQFERETAAAKKIDLHYQDTTSHDNRVQWWEGYLQGADDAFQHLHEFLRGAGVLQIETQIRQMTETNQKLQAELQAEQRRRKDAEEARWRIEDTARDV